MKKIFKVSKIEKVNKKNANVPITVRFPDDIYYKCKNISKQTNQSLNSIIISALKYSLNNLEKV